MIVPIYDRSRDHPLVDGAVFVRLTGLRGPVNEPIG